MKRDQINPHRPSGVAAWFLLWRSARLIEAHARQSVAATGLGLSDFGVLEALLHRGPLSVGELGQRILISSGSTTTSIDRLEQQGFVRRELAGADRRSRTVHLTDTGRSLIEAQFKVHEEDMERAFDCLSDAELTALLPILRQLIRQAGNLARAAEKPDAALRQD
ncbi:MAG: MarR family transcriptional regulator [Candidatus Promineofilum sp.]|nr:MarR family transcriptional regulator [Promineifilum sp.]MCW5862634.1 MarR family transcriptional regulator [Anaerolineae bacterium]